VGPAHSKTKALYFPPVEASKNLYFQNHQSDLNFSSFSILSTPFLDFLSGYNSHYLLALYKVFWDRRDGDLESPPGFDPILAVL
jgi:hypothetical protein